LEISNYFLKILKSFTTQILADDLTDLFPGYSDSYSHGTVTPILCLAGSYNPELGQDEVDDCLVCPGGSTCPNDGMSVPESCGAGYYSPDGYFDLTCIECEPGRVGKCIPSECRVRISSTFSVRRAKSYLRRFL